MLTLLFPSSNYSLNIQTGTRFPFLYSRRATSMQGNVCAHTDGDNGQHTHKLLLSSCFSHAMPPLIPLMEAMLLGEVN